ncbi:acyltransferase family protein [Prescottella agglutinans]|uniref:Peptidoglycan/LPS O-acetylase OafA/YrhL n=1 Tax=Prescottella agglutinans TaxID=1644129 RepID=A0ABT6M7S6_9NOCA|nr:acyltransferase family protein [Prescottella agglutinans]MDH6279831.1 peptidoglycan/LPS O-acetylase OafA/YrhL [Prescottella agglutinans]
MSARATDRSTGDQQGSAAPVRAAYRHDLDGLRGLAIGLVVVYHVWFGRVSGGVDIFLVLSGYFFIGSLLRSAESPAPLDPVPVVRRVTRRLMPALVVVLAAVAVFTVAYHPATSWFETAKQTTASLLFLQNWHLADSASDYLAADPSVSPLQHLWSISVQGQFYLAALVVVFGSAWLLRARGRSVRGPLTVLLAVLAVASLTYAATSDLPQTWLYYDTNARMWELLVGGVLACVAPWLRVPRSARIALSVVGLAIVFGCGMLLDGRSEFPGPWALVPVGAALALIVAGSVETGSADGNPFTRALASRPLLRLGAIAYALYLWHWPILIVYLVLTSRTEAGLTGGLVVIALSLVLAELTTRLIETPIRRPSGTGRTRTALVAVASTLAVLLAAGSVTWSGFIDRRTEEWAQHPDLDPQTHPGAAALFAGADAPKVREEPSRYVAHADLPATTLEDCISQPGQTDPLTCTYGDVDADRAIALIGGSHAEHWLPALDVLGHEHRFRVETYVKVGCPAVLPPSPDAEIGECEEWTFGVVDALTESRPDFVFSTSTRPVPDGPGDYTPDTYTALWHELADRDLPVIGLRDTPWLESNGVQYRAADCLARHGGTADSCGIDRADVLSTVDPAQAATADLPTVQLLDLSDSVCRTDRCRVIEGNVLIYRDSNHLTATYVRTLTPELDRLLGPATGWW